MVDTFHPLKVTRRRWTSTTTELPLHLAARRRRPPAKEASELSGARPGGVPGLIRGQNGQFPGAGSSIRRPNPSGTSEAT